METWLNELIFHTGTVNLGSIDLIYNKYGVSRCISTQLLASEHTFNVYLSSKISTLKAKFD